MKKRLFAHRGMSALAPENTLAAFAKCREFGMTWIECDLDVLGDGTVVLSHDDTLDRCSDKTGSLYDLSKADLMNIDAGSWFSDTYAGEKIPTIQDFIALVNTHQLHVNLEIKSCPGGAKLTEQLIDGVIAEMQHLDKEREVIVSSFNHDVLVAFKQKCPDVSVACLFDYKSFNDDWLTQIKRCQAKYIHLEDKHLTQAVIEKVKAHNVEINVYTVNDIARAETLFAWGVAGVFTDVGHLFPEEYK